MSKFDRVAAVRRAQRVRDNVVAVNELIETLIEIQECQDWLALGYKTWTEYCEGEFGGMKLTAEQRGRVVNVLVASGMPKRRVAAALGVSDGTVRNDTKRNRPIPSAQNYAPPAAAPQLKEPDPADIPAAMTQLLTEAAAASVGAGVTMPAARPAESPCSDAPDRAHCARAGCGVELSGNDQNSGHLRCLSCDPSTLHKALGIGVEEGHGECDECAIQARIAERTSAASVAAANTAGVFPPVGEPDVDVEAASTSGTPSSGSESVGTRLGSGGGEPIADGLDSSPTGAATAPVPVGAAQEQEERIEEEDPGCEKCGTTFVITDPYLAPAHYLRCGACDPHRTHYRTSLPDGPCQICGRTISPAADTSDTESQVVLQQSGPDSPTGREGGRSETDFPVGPDHPVATTVLPGIDHHMSAGVSDSGVAPEAHLRAASVEPVLEGGGLAPDLPSSSDPWLPDYWSGANGDDVLWLFTRIEEVLDRVEPDVVGPVLTVGEIASLHKTADRVAQIASLIEHWRKP